MSVVYLSDIGDIILGEKMIIYRNPFSDPYFNLASEQYLLDSKQGDIFMLWRNESSVIIGKNQNAYAELNLDFVEKNKIKVVRRLTGGGAVFHDIGNVNFSFIVSSEENATLDFERFTRPIIKALTELGIENVCLSGRNDILIDGAKISGNAQSSYNGKTLHHGTLLFSSDLSMLSGALNVDPEKIKSKGIKSVRNRVGNISGFMPTKMDAHSFMEYLENYVARENDAQITDFSAEDIACIEKLRDEKYSTWEWNFGKSKEFSVNKKKRYPFGCVEISLSAESGLIKNVKIRGDFFGMRDVADLENSLVGIKYIGDEIEKHIDEKLLNECISGMDGATFAELMTN